jgi:hypothetical protein
VTNPNVAENLRIAISRLSMKISNTVGKQEVFDAMEIELAELEVRLVTATTTVGGAT